MKGENTVNTGDQRQIGVKIHRSKTEFKPAGYKTSQILVQVLGCTSVKTTGRRKMVISRRRKILEKELVIVVM